MSKATLHTNAGPIIVELFDDDAPKTVENFRKLVRRRLLRRPHLPPRDPGLHGPGRLPRGNRHRRPRLHLRGRVQRPQGRARRAGDGQRRPEHERLAVLHRHHRRPPTGSTASTPSSARSPRGWTPSTRSRRPRPARATARSSPQVIERVELARLSRRPGAWAVGDRIKGVFRTAAGPPTRTAWPSSTSATRASTTGRWSAISASSRPPAPGASSSPSRHRGGAHLGLRRSTSAAAATSRCACRPGRWSEAEEMLG